MAQSMLERTIELVIAQLTTYYLSPERVAQLVASTHAHLMRGQQQEETGGRGPRAARGTRAKSGAWKV